MCLLHTHHVDTILSAAWIEDFYTINSDGIGVMYSEEVDGKQHLVIKKALPRDYAEAQAFYDAEIKGRECVVHWRMATHGDIDFDNCHPYIVLPMDSSCPMALMHNGVLSNGNYKDKKKSDTWHYVHDFLIPLLDPLHDGDPNLIYKEAFVEILGDSIGSSNKFVVMDYAGNVSIINKHAGVNWNGIWLSNTYAWSAPSRVTRKGGGYYQNWKDEQDADWSLYDNKYYTAAQGTSGIVGTSKPAVHDPRLDYLDMPEAPYYRRATPVGKSQTQSTGTTNASGKKNKKQKFKGKSGVVVASVDHKGVVNGAPAGSNGKTNAVLLEEERAVEEMFGLLDDEACHEAYRSLSFQNFYKFVDTTSLDTCWEAVYMLVDGAIDETSFIDYILDPKKWTDNPPPLRTNVGSGEDVNKVLDNIFGDAQVIDEDPTDAEVIEKTLPRSVAVGTDAEPHISDQRNNANVFDIEGGQRVA